eukprot:jgi/Astpho2/1724/Aster-04147
MQSASMLRCGAAGQSAHQHKAQSNSSPSAPRPAIGKVTDTHFCQRRVALHVRHAISTLQDSPAQQLPLRIAELYYAVQHPAMLNTRYSEAINAFAQGAITAYECGYDELSLQQELKRALIKDERAKLQVPSGQVADGAVRYDWQK